MSYWAALTGGRESVGNREDDIEAYERGLHFTSIKVSRAATNRTKAHGMYDFFSNVVLHLQLDLNAGRGRDGTHERELQALTLLPEHLQTHNMEEVFSAEASLGETELCRKRRFFCLAIYKFAKELMAMKRGRRVLEMMEEVASDLAQFSYGYDEGRRLVFRSRLSVVDLCKTITAWFDLETIKRDPEMKRMSQKMFPVMDEALTWTGRDHRALKMDAQLRWEAAVGADQGETEEAEKNRVIAAMMDSAAEEAARLQSYIRYRADTDKSMVEFHRKGGNTAAQA